MYAANNYIFDYIALYNCNSGCSCISEESSVGFSTTKEILMIDSSICSTTTVHFVAECTTVTVTSTYISSCPCTSVEETTALATVTFMANPDVPTTNQIAVNHTASFKTSVRHSTKTVTKTVMLTSTLLSYPCKETYACTRISTLLVTALPTSVEDVYIG